MSEEELSDYCLRCGEPRKPAPGGSDFENLCWPPGRDDYFYSHQFSLKAQRRAKSRDEKKLAAWKEAVTSW